MRNIICPGCQNPAVISGFVETEQTILTPALFALNKLKLMLPQRRKWMGDMDLDFRLFR